MREKIRYWINKVCDGIELLIAIAAVLALLYTGAAYAITKLGIYPLYTSNDSFLLFRKEMFNLVVGILVSVVCVILLYGFNWLVHKKRREEKDTSDTLS